MLLAGIFHAWKYAEYSFQFSQLKLFLLLQTFLHKLYGK